MRRRRRIWMTVMWLVFVAAVLTGCEWKRSDEKKIKDLEYTVCDESRLPEQLAAIIGQKREEPFKLTYRTKDYLYIVVGYGAQDRTDIQVVMSELYLTENAIYVDTQLKTTESTTLANQLVSYPWIAVKCELYDVEVIFQ